MAAPTTHPIAAPVSPEEAALQTVASSAAFQRAPALRRLLVYLWEHRNETLSEYAIGVDVLSKRPDFEPKIDAAVRVHVARLRLKLREYYEAEGHVSPVRFTLPPGAYRLEAQLNAPNLPPTPPEPAARTNRTVRLTVPAALVVMTLAIVWLGVENRRLAKRQAVERASTAQAPLPDFWKRALGNGKLTRIVIPTPVFYSFGQLRVRDVNVNEAAPVPVSPLLKSLERDFGTPGLSQSYAVATDAIALATLTRLFGPAGVPLAIGVTRDLSLELFASDNLIFLGIPHTSEHVAQLLSRTAYHLRNTTVYVRNPRPGEASMYPSGSSDHQRYGVVSVLPGQNNTTRLILLTGANTAALASFLASPVTLRQLDAYLAANGNPAFFEMVVAAETDGTSLLKARPVAIRQISASIWKD